MMTNSNISNGNQHFPLENPDMVLESLFGHTRRLIVDGFKKHKIDLPTVRTKQKIREHTQRQLYEGIVDLNRIIAVLIEIEGWGRQQIYLYKWKGGESLRNQWLDHHHVENRFRQLNLLNVFNNTRPITEQRESSLFTVKYPKGSGKIRLIWVQNRASIARSSDKDPEPPEFEVSADGTCWQRTVLRAHIETIVRDVTTFEWDIASCEAMIMIRKLKGTKYKPVRDEIETELADIVPMVDLETVSMSKLINNLDNIEDVIRPKLRYRPLNDPDITVTFARRNKKDVLSNPLIQGMRKIGREDFNGYGGISFWPVGNGRYVGMDLYAMKESDHRIGIRGEQLEKDVRRVLQRIRVHCA